MWLLTRFIYISLVSNIHISFLDLFSCIYMKSLLTHFINLSLVSYIWVSSHTYKSRFIYLRWGFVVETKRFVGSNVNVTLTRQTCGQRSSRAAERKRRALGNYFSERICYMFLISKCRGDWDLGLCTTSRLALGEPQRSGDFREKNMFRRRKNRILPVRCGSPNVSLEVVHRHRSQSPLHFNIMNI